MLASESAICRRAVECMKPPWLSSDSRCWAKASSRATVMSFSDAEKMTTSSCTRSAASRVETERPPGRTSPSSRRTKALSNAGTAPPFVRVEPTMALLVLGPSTAVGTSQRSSSIPTATTWRRSSTRRSPARTPPSALAQSGRGHPLAWRGESLSVGEDLGCPRAREEPMDPRIHVITLAVLDLDRALEFYRDGLGLDTRGVVATEFTGDELTPAGAIAIFELADGLLLALYPRTELAKDANISIEPAGVNSSP